MQTIVLYSDKCSLIIEIYMIRTKFCKKGSVLMEQEMEKVYNKRLEKIKHTDENGIEFWYARKLMRVLQYANGKTLIRLEKKLRKELK